MLQATLALLPLAELPLLATNLALRDVARFVARLPGVRQLIIAEAQRSFRGPPLGGAGGPLACRQGVPRGWLIAVPQPPGVNDMRPAPVFADLLIRCSKPQTYDHTCQAPKRLEDMRLPSS